MLDGKIAIVTGGGSGIGKAIAAAIAGAGARVVVVGRRRAPLEAASAEIDGAVEAAECDVTDDVRVDGLFDDVAARHGRIDVLVNNAGMSAPGPTHELDPATWRKVIDVNLTGAFLCARAAFRHMIPQRSGRIINIGSISAQMSRPHGAPYTASKFGLEGLTRSLALDGREYGIAAGIIHPGNVATDIWRGREEIAAREGTIPLADIGKAAVTMASMDSGVNMLSTVILPITQPYIGRG